MKKLAPLVISACLALFACSCGTARTTGTVDPYEEAAAVAELAAYVGTVVRLSSNPEERPIFEAVAIGLAAAIEAEDYDPVRFMEVLRDLPVRQIKSDEAAIIIGSSVILWERTSRRILRLDTSNSVKPILEAVYFGMRRALVP